MKNFDHSKKTLQRLELKFKALALQKKDYCLISRDFIEETLKNLYYLKQYQKNLINKEEVHDNLKNEMQILQNKIQNQEDLLKTIDFSYIDKINDLKYTIANLNEEKKKNEQIYIDKIQSLQDENEKLRSDLLNINETIAAKLSEIQECQNQKKCLEERLKEFENTRDYTQLNPNKTDVPWIDLSIQKKLALILKSSIGDVLFVFLKPKDIFSLSLIDKTTFQWFSFHGKQYLFTLKFSEKKWRTQFEDLKHKMDYFKRTTNKIPDEFMKSAIIRFVCQKEKIGNYMPAILHEAQKLVFLPNDEEPEKLKKSKPNTSSLKIEKPSNQALDSMNNLIAKLFPNMGSFLKIDLFQAVGIETKEMVAKAFEKASEISYNLKEKFPEFSEIFCKSFAKLLVFSAFLLQDSKQLENLKDYMISNYEQSFIDLENLLGKFEDLREDLKTEKINKEFISQRLREMEKKLHESDSKVLKLLDEKIILTQNIRDDQEEIANLKKDFILKEKHLKVLASELKQAKLQINSLKNEIKELIDNCLDVKLLFERLDLNI